MFHIIEQGSLNDNWFPWLSAIIILLVGMTSAHLLLAAK